MLLLLLCGLQLLPLLANEDVVAGEVVFWHQQRPWLRISPKAGRLVMFSSGMEHIHRVEPVTGGVRFAIPFVLEAVDSTAEGDVASQFVHSCVKGNHLEAQAWQTCSENYATWVGD